MQDDEVRWRHTDNRPATEHVMHSPSDPAARWSQKRETAWFGYKAHITDTCDADRPHLITHIITTSATTQDEQVTESMHRALAQKHLQWACQREHTDAFKERYAKRAGIEGTISQGVRAFG